MHPAREAADLAVDPWDVADATGQTLQRPRELLSHVVATGEQVPEHVLRGPDLFGPAQQAPADADNTTKLMAWLGQKPLVPVHNRKGPTASVAGSSCERVIAAGGEV
jgi:hypothetical protein